MHLRNLTFIFALFVAASCSNTQGEGGPGSTGQVKEYRVMAVESHPVTLDKHYPATLQGKQTVEIRPRVAGYIEEILVDEGASVKKGQVLFRLNANDLQATVRSAEAQVKVAEAQIVAAQITLKKTKPLVEKNIVSSFELESAESALQAKEAQLAQAKANLANAKANLQYTRITSPTDGIIGTFPYRVGSLVSSAIAQPLTTVSNTQEMYAYFSMNEKDFLLLTNELEGDNLQQKFGQMADVSLLLADNSIYPQTGSIQTASGLVDIATGAVNIRATFPNANAILRNGSSGTVRIHQHLESALLIPQKATFELQGKHFVYAVGNDNQAKTTQIEVISGSLKDNYIVTSGLAKGDKVVVEGIAGLRDNTPIKPKLVSLELQAEANKSSN